MSLDLLDSQDEYEQSKKPEVFPDWVCHKNKSIEAYRALKECEKKRRHYLKLHNKASDFRAKKKFQIPASEIAKMIGIALPTLDPSGGSRWAAGFRTELENINKELEAIRDHRLGIRDKNKQKGITRRDKAELILENQQLRKELEDERRNNAVDALEAMLAKVTLPVKRKLGLND